MSIFIVQHQNGQWQGNRPDEKYDDGQWHGTENQGNSGQYDDGSWHDDTERSEISSNVRLEMDNALVDEIILIPNGVNEWNRERYEITGYINNINTQYTQVLMEYGADSEIGNIYEYGTQRNSLTNNGKTSYYAYDGRGSVSEVLSSTGSAQMRYQYSAFGETTTRYNEYIDNPYRYNAEYTDYVPGIPDMQYLRARYYAPHEGRFFSQDTLFGDVMSPLTQNLYLYCHNNAVMFTDPSGNCEVPLTIRMSGATAISSYLRGKPCRCGTTVRGAGASAHEEGSGAPLPPKTEPTAESPSETSDGSSIGYSRPTQEDARRAAEEARRRAEERRKRYENGQMGLFEKTYFDQMNEPIPPKPTPHPEVTEQEKAKKGFWGNVGDSVIVILQGGEVSVGVGIGIGGEVSAGNSSIDIVAKNDFLSFRGGKDGVFWGSHDEATVAGSLFGLGASWSISKEHRFGDENCTCDRLGENLINSEYVCKAWSEDEITVNNSEFGVSVGIYRGIGGHISANYNIEQVLSELKNIWEK